MAELPADLPAELDNTPGAGEGPGSSPGCGAGGGCPCRARLDALAAALAALHDKVDTLPVEVVDELHRRLTD